jgi:hypothetical protein
MSSRGFPPAGGCWTEAAGPCSALNIPIGHCALSLCFVLGRASSPYWEENGACALGRPKRRDWRIKPHGCRKGGSAGWFWTSSGGARRRDGFCASSGRLLRVLSWEWPTVSLLESWSPEVGLMGIWRHSLRGWDFHWAQGVNQEKHASDSLGCCLDQPSEKLCANLVNNRCGFHKQPAGKP